MKRSLALLAALVAALSLSAQAPAPAPAAPAAPVDASAPIEKNDPSGRFRKMHESFLAREAHPIGVDHVVHGRLGGDAHRRSGVCRQGNRVEERLSSAQWTSFRLVGTGQRPCRL